MNLLVKITCIISLLASTVTFQQVVKKVDVNNSTVTWTGKKFLGSHTGTIKMSSGRLEFNNGNLSDGSFVIDMTSINNTDLSGGSKEKLEGYLKSEDFFDVKGYPRATLEFTTIKKKTNQLYTITAALTIKETTRPVSFDLVISKQMATTTLTIDRKEFDVQKKGLGDQLIYDDMEIEVKLAW